ncbi:hypothetical protein E1B28_011755 [Marasmius oreades]|uniref:Uncharacterized protein n=1 Tax=Marasmius oreades TaxID=181124 RepID=A0A9P7RUY7_9AGAR|nr:uncharacterized protein E1B28_011755 [Marasmius oreades]KAG7090147.1 hypothetical protein E1B28_011755 [Marasmius oreades]
MSDTNCRTMEVLADATGTAIDRSHFSNVGRDQYNNYTTHNNIYTGEKRKKVGKDLPVDLSEFTEIKRGDIYRDQDVRYSWKLLSNGRESTEATVYHAEINITGSFGHKKFTVKTYHGLNAMKEWRRDFSRCSQDWQGNIPLFGYNVSSYPSLIFHGELVPLASVEARLGLVGCFYIQLLNKRFGCSRNELWVDSKGGFRRGPIGPLGRQCHFWRDDDRDIEIPSDMKFLKEEVVFRYFFNVQDDLMLLCVLGYSHVKILKDIPAINYPHVISSLTNSTIASTEIWLRTHFDKGQRIGIGAQRFRLMDDQRKIELYSYGERESWLSQAWSVFHAHNLSMNEDLSNFKFVQSFFELRGTLQNSERKQQRRQRCAPIYLILFSFPSLCYHWSLDLTGQTPLSPDMCKYLGLPFKLSQPTKAYAFQFSAPTKIYKIISDYQIARGFDPKTTDFAQHLGWPTFKIIHPESRFQEIVEEHEVCTESGAQLLWPVVSGVREDSKLVSDSLDLSDGNQVEDSSLEKDSDDSFSLELLFHEIQAEGDESPTTSDSADDVNPAETGNSTAVGGTIYVKFAQAANLGSTQMLGIGHSLVGPLFAPFLRVASASSNRGSPSTLLDVD